MVTGCVLAIEKYERRGQMGSQPPVELDRQEKKDMETSILQWTGQVREVLGESGPMPLANLARRIDNATTNEVAMAVGWLARAGKIRFRKRAELWEISLQD